MRAPSRRHMLIPKGRYKEKPFPPIPAHACAWLGAKIGPPERHALRFICESADVLLIGDDEVSELAPPRAGLFFCACISFEFGSGGGDSVHGFERGLFRG